MPPCQPEGVPPKVTLKPRLAKTVYQSHSDAPARLDCSQPAGKKKSPEKIPGERCLLGNSGIF